MMMQPPADRAAVLLSAAVHHGRGGMWLWALYGRVVTVTGDLTAFLMRCGGRSMGSGRRRSPLTAARRSTRPAPPDTAPLLYVLHLTVLRRRQPRLQAVRRSILYRQPPRMTLHRIRIYVYLPRLPGRRLMLSAPRAICYRGGGDGHGCRMTAGSTRQRCTGRNCRSSMAGG